MVLDEKAVFVAALELPAKEREAYLQEACAGHPELLGRLRELLSAHEQSQGPLDHRPGALGVTVDEAPRERPGTLIGPYKLCSRSAKAAWARSTLPSRPSLCSARSPSSSSSRAWTAGRLSPASRPS